MLSSLWSQIGFSSFSMLAISSPSIIFPWCDSNLFWKIFEKYLKNLKLTKCKSSKVAKVNWENRESQQQQMIVVDKTFYI